MRLSIDTKASINIGPFARGGYNRCNVHAAYHDFAPDSVLKLFGIYLPAFDENHMYFTESNVTADFMVDCLDSLWFSLKQRFNPHTIVINADNGPENSSRRTQFIDKIIVFGYLNNSYSELLHPSLFFGMVDNPYIDLYIPF